jgi:hypothetical protein
MIITAKVAANQNNLRSWNPAEVGAADEIKAGVWRSPEVARVMGATKR